MRQGVGLGEGNFFCLFAFFKCRSTIVISAVGSEFDPGPDVEPSRPSRDCFKFLSCVFSKFFLCSVF